MNISFVFRSAAVFLLLATSLFAMTACSLLGGPVESGNKKTYLLTQINPDNFHKKTTQATLLVSTVQADPVYQGTGMIYLQQPYELTSFSLSQWGAPPAQMLTPLILKSLLNTKHYRAVFMAPYVGPVTYQLNTQLLYLYQNFIEKPSQIHLGLSARLSHVSDNKLLMAKVFEVTVKAPQNNPYSGVVAANQAVAQLLGKISRTVVQSS